MGKTVEESGVVFGPFEETKFFDLEKSDIACRLGEGIKKVEFIFLRGTNEIVFLEAKSSCPNPNNVRIDNEKKYSAYYDDIAEKFSTSLNVYTSSLLGITENINEIGLQLQTVVPLREKTIKFVLVITDKSMLEEWLQSPKLELEKRLFVLRKIWKIQVIILNRELAKILKYCS